MKQKNHYQKKFRKYQIPYTENENWEKDILSQVLR